MNKVIFIIYARKTDRHDWNIQGTASRPMEAVNKAKTLLDTIENDARFVNEHWQIQVVSVYDNQFNGQYPPTMKFNTYWPDAGMIPYISMQQNPDQTIHNGGN